MIDDLANISILLLFKECSQLDLRRYQSKPHPQNKGKNTSYLPRGELWRCSEVFRGVAWSAKMVRGICPILDWTIFKESESSKITRGIQFIHLYLCIMLQMFGLSLGRIFLKGLTHLDLTASGRAWSPRVGISHDVVLMERNPKAKPPGMVLKPCK